MKFDQEHFLIVNKEIQRHCEDTKTSKLAHWHAAKMYEKIHRIYIGLPATVLSIILAWFVSADAQKLISTEGTGSGWISQIPVVLGLIISILSGLSAFLNLSDLSARHRSTGESLHALWRDCINWSTDFPDASDCEKAVETAQAYRRRLNEINRDAPQPPKWAWKSVPKQLEEGSVSYSNEIHREKRASP